MIDTATLTANATERRLVRLLVPPAGRITCLVLWPEPATEHTSYTRDDAWRVLVHNPATPSGGWIPEIIFARDAVLVDRLERVVFPLDDATRADGADARVLCEVVSLAARFGADTTFHYRKAGEAKPSARAGVILGTRGDLVFVRHGEAGIKSYKMGGISDVRLDSAVPRWDGAAYVQEVRGA